MLGDSETTEAANALLVEVSASGEVQVIGGNTSVTSPTTTADDSDDADTAHTTSKSTPSGPLRSVKMPRKGMLIHVAGFRPMHFGLSDYIQVCYP